MLSFNPTYDGKSNFEKFQGWVSSLEPLFTEQVTDKSQGCLDQQEDLEETEQYRNR